MNRLYFGDNLKWLADRKQFPDASVDLVYLDPPLNSNADYNVLFRERRGLGEPEPTRQGGSLITSHQTSTSQTSKISGVSAKPLPIGKSLG